MIFFQFFGEETFLRRGNSGILVFCSVKSLICKKSKLLGGSDQEIENCAELTKHLPFVPVFRNNSFALAGIHLPPHTILLAILFGIWEIH